MSHDGRYAHLHSLNFFLSFSCAHTRKHFFYLVLLRRAIYLHINNNNNKSHQTQAASCVRSSAFFFLFLFSCLFSFSYSIVHTKNAKVSQRKCASVFETFLHFRVWIKNKSIIIDIECAMQVNLTSGKKPTRTHTHTHTDRRNATAVTSTDTTNKRYLYCARRRT